MFLRYKEDMNPKGEIFSGPKKEALNEFLDMFTKPFF